LERANVYRIAVRAAVERTGVVVHAEAVRRGKFVVPVYVIPVYRLVMERIVDQTGVVVSVASVLSPMHASIMYVNQPLSAYRIVLVRAVARMVAADNAVTVPVFAMRASVSETGQRRAVIARLMELSHQEI
jgi:hypothetical protein